jgi:hypothetical protein
MNDLLRTVLYFIGFIVAAVILYKLGVLLIAEL